MGIKQLRYLKECTLQLAEKVKQSDGSYSTTYTNIETYKVQIEELSDTINASIYGANLNRIYKLSSIRYELEKYLFSKVDYSSDNISKYFVLIEGKRYKVISVRSKWVDVELQ